MLICTPKTGHEQWAKLREYDIMLAYTTMLSEARTVIPTFRPDLVVVDDYDLTSKDRSHIIWLLNVGSHHNDFDAAFVSHYWRTGIPAFRGSFNHAYVFPMGLDWERTRLDLGIPKEPKPELYKPISIHPTGPPPY